MQWMTMAEAAGIAKVNIKLIYAAAKSGALRVSGVGAGRNLRTSREWLEEYMAGCERTSLRDGARTAAATATGKQEVS